jgi:FtsZ-interacting cell division protein ZipA
MIPEGSLLERKVETLMFVILIVVAALLVAGLWYVRGRKA